MMTRSDFCRKIWKGAAVAVLAVSAFATPAKASPVTLFSTGVDDLGVQLPAGANDSHWSIVAPAGPGVVVTDQSPAGGNYFQSPASKWIWVSADGTPENGTYTFRQTFDLTGFNPATAVITGDWGVDNSAEILLNGATPTGSGALDLPFGFPAFQQLNGFQITGGFVAGINTLDFVVTNSGGPGALNVTNLTATAAVPEPGSLALLGLGVIGGVIRRRRKTLAV